MSAVLVPCLVSRSLVEPFGGPLWITVRRYCAVEYCVVQTAYQYLEQWDQWALESCSKTTYVCRSAVALIAQLEYEEILNACISRQVAQCVRENEERISLEIQEDIALSIRRQELVREDLEQCALELEYLAEEREQLVGYWLAEGARESLGER